MKTLILLIVIAATTFRSQAQTPSFCYVAIVFQDNDPKTVAKGVLDASTFKRWFATGYPVGGTRVSIPSGSSSFGALFVYSGSQVLTMPFYQTDSGAFICQGHTLGEAPEFGVLENSQPKFIVALKKRLADLHP